MKNVKTTPKCIKSIFSLVVFSVQGRKFLKIQPTTICRLELILTEIGPKHSGVIWAQNKCHFWTQHPSKPLYRHFVWPYLWIFSFFIFLYFGVMHLISPNWGGQLATSHPSWVVIYAHVNKSKKWNGIFSGKRLRAWTSHFIILFLSALYWIGPCMEQKYSCSVI